MYFAKEGWYCFERYTPAQGMLLHFDYLQLWRCSYEMQGIGDQAVAAVLMLRKTLLLAVDSIVKETRVIEL